MVPHQSGTPLPLGRSQHQAAAKTRRREGQDAQEGNHGAARRRGRGSSSTKRRRLRSASSSFAASPPEPRSAPALGAAKPVIYLGCLASASLAVNAAAAASTGVPRRLAAAAGTSSAPLCLKGSRRRGCRGGLGVHRLVVG